MSMEWKEINELAQKLAYEFLKKVGSSRAESFNPETMMCGIEKDSSVFFERIEEDTSDDCAIRGIRLNILTKPKRKNEEVE